MSKIQLLVVGVGGWIVVHVGLVLFGAALGGGATFLHFTGDGEEKEIYTYDEGYDAGYSDGFMEGLNKIVVTETDNVQEVAPTPTPTEEGIPIALSFYTCPPFCGTMTNGKTVHEGASACGYAFELGMRFTIDGDPTGRTYTCKDRGSGSYYWVDIFFPDSADGYLWISQVGVRGVIKIVEGSGP